MRDADDHEAGGSAAPADPAATYAAEKASVGTVVLLWFFFGGFGAHRFYLGKTRSGFAQLALTVCGIFIYSAPYGGAILLPIAAWMLYDAGRISEWVEAHNAALESRFGR